MAKGDANETVVKERHQLYVDQIPGMFCSQYSTEKLL